MAEKNENPGRPEGEIGIKMLNRMNKSHAPLREWGFKYLNLTDSMHILDVGCGGGATISDLLELAENSYVEGLDYAQESVDLSRKYNSKFIDTRCRIHLGNVQDLQFDENTFDLITAVETVYFWPDIKTALSQVFRVTKKSGVFFILCEMGNPSQYSQSDFDFYINLYEPDELRKLCIETGFADVKIKRGPNNYYCIICRK